MLSDLDVADPGRHVVQFYESDDTLALAVSDFLGAGLVAGETALVVATPEHLAAFERDLAAAGVDVASAKGAGRYVVLDAAELLDTFVVAGVPKAAMFRASVGALVEELVSAGRLVRIYGEMVAVLWDAGHVAAAVRLEELWNDLLAATAFTLFCAYPSRSVDGSPVHLDAICTRHSYVVPDVRPHSGGPDDASRRFEPTPFAAPAARRFVTETLRGWGVGDATRDAVQVVVGELVTNAVRHSRGRFRVAVSRRGGVVRVAVTDRSTLMPAPRAGGELAVGGRGMPLIGMLSERWGVDPHDGGKTVWAEVG